MIKILILLTDLLIFEDISVTVSVYWYNKAVVRDPKENPKKWRREILGTRSERRTSRSLREHGKIQDFLLSSPLLDSLYQVL